LGGARSGRCWWLLVAAAPPGRRIRLSSPLPTGPAWLTRSGPASGGDGGGISRPMARRGVSPVLLRALVSHRHRNAQWRCDE
jgi:hypothetical protein